MHKSSIKNIAAVLCAVMSITLFFNRVGVEAFSHISEEQTSKSFVEDILILQQQNEKKQAENFVEDVNALLSEEEVKEDNLTESQEEFRTARIIVKSENPIDDYTAKRSVCGYNDLYIFQYETAEEAENAYKRFQLMDDIIYVQPDRTVSVQEVDNDNFLEETDNNNWGISFMNMPEYEEFLNNADIKNTNDIVVAVVDTGIREDANEVFEGRVLDGISFTYIDEFIVRTENFNPNNKNDNLKKESYVDDNGHGTSVAGIIAQSTPDNVKILPIKALDAEGSGSDLAVYTGILYALEKDADVINLSCGALGESDLYNEIAAVAESLGVTLVAAAGNEMQDVKNITPASIPSVVTVTSINRDYELSSFSNYGSTVDFAAPGEDLVLIDYKGGYRIDSGTSFSAPLITSAAAMLLCANPNYKSSEIFDVLVNNAIDIGDDGWDEKFGYGWIDMTAIEDDVAYYVMEANGDANNDGGTDVTDALYVLKAASGEIEMDYMQKARIGLPVYKTAASSHALAIMMLVVGRTQKFSS